MLQNRKCIPENLEDYMWNAVHNDPVWKKYVAYLINSGERDLCFNCSRLSFHKCRAYLNSI